MAIQEAKLLVLVILACVIVPASVLAQEVGPPVSDFGVRESSTALELELGFGLQVDSVFSLLSVRGWFNNVLGVEVVGGALIVPGQVTIRGLWKALETEVTQFYLAPGCTLRGNGLGIHVTAGTQWSVAENIYLNLEVGLGYILPGGWFPPGPVPFVGGSRLYTFLGAGVHFYLKGPWIREAAPLAPVGPLF